jgi:uroporphyrin-III C-methyltransferase/precorrin-2 dehydrogenase/sirohydrochlorin ferrochelatase
VNYFPVFFDLTGQRVLIVGGGEVALRKITLLERTGALITVVAPAIAPEVMALAAAGKLKLAIREFEPADLDGARLVIVATSRRAVNRWIAKLSEARNIPVNVVDDRDASRFIVPAIIDRDPVLVAISTGGTSPVLARRLRERLEALIPARIGELAAWLKALRKAARRNLRDTDERRRFFEAVVDGPAARRFIDGDQAGAQRIAQQLLATTSAAPRAPGEVTLVGAGPGDPELLTLKALRALQDADVILHDRLVPPAVLDLARRDASRICVGKAAGSIGSTQEDINALLIELATQGKRVVRLKGGDPFVFGRGGEELQALAKARINFSVVPGITAALGAAAYSGIPLTHREFAHSVTFVAGHAHGHGDVHDHGDAQGQFAAHDHGDAQGQFAAHGHGDAQGQFAAQAQEPDWRALAMPGTTAVFYMGLARLDHIVAKLLEHGASATRPAGIIAQATTAKQRVITATLATIQGASSEAKVESPALLVVGDVVALHSTLAWFDTAAGADLSRSA